MSNKKENDKKPLIKKKESEKVETPKAPSAEEEIAEMDAVDSGPYSSIFGYD